MTRFPSDHEPQVFSSLKQEASWAAPDIWLAMPAGAIVMFAAGFLGCPQWLTIAIGIVAYFGIPFAISRTAEVRASKHAATHANSRINVEEPPAEKLAAVWKNILKEDPPSAWVLFSHGTCVLFTTPVDDPKSEAISLLKEWGPYEAGSSSGDLIVSQLRNNMGFVVGCHQPDIFTFIDGDIGLGENTNAYVPGLIGRATRGLDAKVLKVVYVG